MTVNTFLKDFKAELEGLFADFPLTDESGAQVRLNVFIDSLPIPEGEDSPEPFPYLVIRAMEGGKDEPDAAEVVKVIILIGIYDGSTENRGYVDVRNVIDRLRQRFERDPVLAGKYLRLHSASYPIRWTIPDEDTWPYFFGGVELSFALPSVTQGGYYE